MRRLIMNTFFSVLLADFSLPEQDWKDGGSKTTLGMLASHTAEMPRESYNTELNMILSTGKSGRCDHWRGMDECDT
jgi:hypothetical protein